MMSTSPEDSEAKPKQEHNVTQATILTQRRAGPP